MYIVQWCDFGGNLRERRFRSIRRARTYAQHLLRAYGEYAVKVFPEK